jgi:methyl-accepting chemotaxis protein
MRDNDVLSLQNAKLVDGIEFRADLLALSASVEMACAGEETEFALVANKIRDLARRGALVARPPTVGEQERIS